MFIFSNKKKDGLYIYVCILLFSFCEAALWLKDHCHKQDTTAIQSQMFNATLSQNKETEVKK